MQISDKEMRKVLQKDQIVDEIEKIAEARLGDEDMSLVREIVQRVIAMPDREVRIEELRARVQSGQYRVTANEIVNAMVRRAVADKIR